MHKNIFTDSFVLHDKPTFWKDETEKDANDEESNPIKNKSVAKSERELLYEKWMKFCKFFASVEYQKLLWRENCILFCLGWATCYIAMAANAVWSWCFSVMECIEGLSYLNK